MRLGAAERTQNRIRRAELDRITLCRPAADWRAPRCSNAPPGISSCAYLDWLRPDLMAVIVVGDVDRNVVATMIRELFCVAYQPQPRAARAGLRRARPAPRTRYAVVTDKEATATLVRLSTLPPARNQGTVGGCRDIMRDQLFAAMLDARLDELSQGVNPPFINPGADRGTSLASFANFSARAADDVIGVSGVGRISTD